MTEASTTRVTASDRPAGDARIPRRYRPGDEVSGAQRGRPFPHYGIGRSPRHTRPVRLALIVLGIAAGSTSARADSVGSYGEPARPVNKDFWQEVVDPRGDEVAAVIAKINQALDVAAQLPTNDSDPDGSQRARLLDEARGMARYLRRIAPANPEVLMTL